MKYLVCVLLLAATANGEEGLKYPLSRVSDHAETLHGKTIQDPYRWLEDANSTETKSWIQAQNTLTMPYLAALPGRDAIHDRIRQVYNYERWTKVFRSGDRYFWFHNNGLQNRSVLYTASSLQSAGEVLMDPNKFEDKTVAISSATPSPDGKTMAVSLQKAGSDWLEIIFVDVATRQRLSDKLQWVKFFTPSWAEDSKGLYYSRYDEPGASSQLQELNENHKAFFHKLGTTQDNDQLLLFRPEKKKWMYDIRETEDRRYLIAGVFESADERAAYLYRERESDKWIELLPGFSDIHKFVGSEGTRFFFTTTAGAPRGRLVEVDIRNPQPANWKNIIPEGRESLLGASYINGTFVAQYSKDGHTRVALVDPSGKFLGDVPLPTVGQAWGFEGRQKDTETFFVFTSYTVPVTVYRLDMKTRQVSPFRQPRLPVDMSRFETKLVFYNSKDGTRVPMFITGRKGLKLDGSHPVYLYGYGGFNVPVMIGFSPAHAVWLEMGGVLAFPGIRGGGEYGTEWHLAGTKDRKQNVFDDFVAAAEYLIGEKYTSANRIGIRGGSNGGLLVAATMLQRPDLFGAVIPEVGVLDMLRFHKFTIGWSWQTDFGSPDNPQDFKALLAYSPYHNVKKGTVYPPTLITTADHDDRVVPGHSFKFAAAMQAAQEGKAPILIRVQTKAGHGAGKPLSMQIEEEADVFAFLAKHLGIAPPPAAAKP
ncbi:MAG TPA: prolyl oligopeptidase family serine peptidase [Bryobacteraceae bacterium]|nr:prolyl oligopeptidase family serine peptidase [Bryobacteraceae bacterium]